MIHDKKCKWHKSCGYDFCHGEGICPEFEKGKPPKETEKESEMSILFDTIEALQQENEQLQAQVARTREALRKARETISAWDRVNWFECDRCKNMRDALAAIDKVIGGKEEGKEL